MSITFPKKGVIAFVNIAEGFTEKSKLEKMSFSFDKDGMRICSTEGNEDNTSYCVFWDEKITGMKHKYILANCLSRIYSVFKDALETANGDVAIDFEESSDCHKIYLNGVMISKNYNTRSPDICGYRVYSDTGFVTMTKQELKENFENRFEFSNSMEWKDNSIAGVSLFFKGDEVKKAVFSPSCIVFDNEIHGSVNKNVVNSSYRHSKGHLIFTKEMYKILSQMPGDKISFHFDYSFDLTDYNGEKQQRYFTAVTDEANYTFNVTMRAKHWETYERNNGILQLSTEKTIELERNAIFPFLNKIIKFKDFETENVHFIFEDKVLKICDLQENELIKLRLPSIKEKDLKIAFNIYVLYRIFKYAPEGSNVKFELKQVSQEEKYVVFSNDKDKTIFIVHAL